MESWEASYSGAGWSWTAASDTRCQAAFYCYHGAWSVTCTRYPAGRRQRAFFSGPQPGEAGLNACLMWLVEYLTHAGEPAFDVLEAKQALMLA